jgi:hypothetical protein
VKILPFFELGKVRQPLNSNGREGPRTECRSPYAVSQPHNDRFFSLILDSFHPLLNIHTSIRRWLWRSRPRSNVCSGLNRDVAEIYKTSEPHQHSRSNRKSPNQISAIRTTNDN